MTSKTTNKFSPEVREPPLTLFIRVFTKGMVALAGRRLTHVVPRYKTLRCRFSLATVHSH